MVNSSVVSLSLYLSLTEVDAHSSYIEFESVMLHKMEGYIWLCLGERLLDCK